jgi:hypothetical protein
MNNYHNALRLPSELLNKVIEKQKEYSNLLSTKVVKPTPQQPPQQPPQREQQKSTEENKTQQ